MILNMTGSCCHNFTVTGTLTAPANPRENTLWIETDQGITLWVISAPEPAAPVEGMVWIAMNSSGSVSFNALKDGVLLVQPGNCRQYLGGSWTEKAGKLFQSGAWVSLQ